MINVVREQIRNWIHGLPVSAHLHDEIESAIGLISVVLLAILCQRIVRFVARLVLPGVFAKFAGSQDERWVKAAQKHLVAGRSAHVVGALVARRLVPSMLSATPKLESVIVKLVDGYLIIVATVATSAIIGAIGVVSADRHIRSQLSIRVATQAIQGLVVVTGLISLISVFIGQPVAVLLSTFAGATAVLMLLFKDSILGLVAGIQLSTNDMLRIGDWIEMPHFGADGTVIDVRLTTVKVQNFDKTITTIPTYALVSQSFKNWRGMHLSGSRRIKRAIAIDMDSVGFLTGDQVEQLKRVTLLRSYLDEATVDIRLHNERIPVADRHPPNARQLTNLGTFRVYLEQYLDAHPSLNEDMLILVRHLPPSADGLPIEIYAFSREQDWEKYERIQSNIFDHILAVMPTFGLRPFQSLRASANRKP